MALPYHKQDDGLPLPPERTLDSITWDEIRWLLGIFRCDSSGSGRNKQYHSWRGVKTKLGEIEESAWYKLAEALIERDHEEGLYEQLLEWETEHNYANSSKQDLRGEALCKHSMRIFDNPGWVDFVPFNRRYRPEALVSAHLVTVVCECCNLPGEVTEEQIDSSYNGTVHCPYCGRWAPFKII